MKNDMKPLTSHTVTALISSVLLGSNEASESLKKLLVHHKEIKVKTGLKNKGLRFNKGMKIVPIGTHGGERTGAGRPAPRGETIVKRIPRRYKSAVEALIEHLDETRGKPGAVGYTSKTQCRNLNDVLITLQFQSKSRKKEM